MSQAFPHKTPRCIPEDKYKPLEKIDKLKDEQLADIYTLAFQVPLKPEQLVGGVKKAVVRDLQTYYDIINTKD